MISIGPRGRGLELSTQEFKLLINGFALTFHPRGKRTYVWRPESSSYLLSSWETVLKCGAIVPLFSAIFIIIFICFTEHYVDSI